MHFGWLLFVRIPALQFGWMILVSMVLATPELHAAGNQERELKLRFDVEYTDNSRLLADPFRVEEFEITPALDLLYGFRRNRVEGNLLYSIDHNEYIRDTFDNRTNILGTGSAKLILIEHRLNWNLLHERSRLLKDSQSTDIQTNQTHREVISTGPNLQFNIGKQRSVNVDLSYVSSNFDNGISNESEQGRLNVRYRKFAESGNSFGLSANYAEVMFQNSSSDYQTATVGMDFEGGLGDLSYQISIGGNTVDRETGLSFSGLYFSLGSSLALDKDTWKLGVNRELTDSSIGLGLSSNLLEEFDPADANPEDSDIIERTRLELSYVHEIDPGRWEFDLKLFGDDEDYQVLAQDRRTIGAAVRLKYFSTRRLSFIYRGSWRGEKFEESSLLSERSTDISHRLLCNFNPYENMTLSFSVGHNRKFLVSHARDSDELIVGASITLQI